MTVCVVDGVRSCIMEMPGRSGLSRARGTLWLCLIRPSERRWSLKPPPHQDLATTYVKQTMSTRHTEADRASFSRNHWKWNRETWYVVRRRGTWLLGNRT